MSDAAPSGAEAAPSRPYVGRGPEGGPDDPPPKVLFVMGYGRSGSTFLDVLLNNAPGATSVGALGHYWTWLLEGEPCACGMPLPECEFWRDVVRDHLRRVPDRGDLEHWREVQEAVERRGSLLRLLTGRLDDDLLEAYRAATDALLDEVRMRAGDDVLIDSSGSGARSTGRAYALARHAEADVRVLHLVRDGRAVAWSALKGPGSPERPRVHLPRPLKALRAAASWAFTNTLCELMAARLGRDRVLRVRYEDVAARPAETLRRIGAFAGLEVEPLVEKVEADASLEVGHNVAGNRLRFRDEIRVRPDFSWREEMSAWYRLKLTLELWPWLLRYGYPLWPRAGDAPEPAGAGAGGPGGGADGAGER